MEAFAYFPSIVYREERPDLVEVALPSCLSALDAVRQENLRVSQSGHLGGVTALQDITSYILLSSVEILRSQGYDVGKYDFYLSGVWAQEILNSFGTNVHVHKNSQVCGWLFLETPENGAYPVYHDCRSNKAMIELDFAQGVDITNATNTIHFNNVTPGTILFSNSWMQHQLVGGTSDSPTRCIHFIVSHKERACNTY
jgi:hypothetical protein